MKRRSEQHYSKIKVVTIEEVPGETMPELKTYFRASKTSLRDGSTVVLPIRVSRS